ncbi:MAG: IS3 family transposase [Candidatus Velthaea sp.]
MAAWRAGAQPRRRRRERSNAPHHRQFDARERRDEAADRKKLVRALPAKSGGEGLARDRLEPARSVRDYRLSAIGRPIPIQTYDEPQLVERLTAIAMERRRFGYRRLTLMLRREGIAANHKRVHRIYRGLGLQLRPRRKRGVRYVRGATIAPVTRPNERWSLDFVHDRLANGRKFRMLTIVDDFSRECVGIEADFSFPSARVIRAL